MNSGRPCPIVTLTTDFGCGSSYVAQMKGVLLSKNAGISLVDISHAIQPQNIREGALALADACPHFPADTIHVAVVDPGVGTDRQIVFAQIGTQRYIAPDNGLLTLLADRTPPSQIIDVTNRSFFLPEVSPTFHGRDIMAPVAGNLSLGLDPQQLGMPRDALMLLPFPKAIVENHRITGHILSIDPFGNLITNITRDQLPASHEKAKTVRVLFKSKSISGLISTYGRSSPGSLVALIGSNGRLEVAVVNGNAARLLSASVDEPIIVDWSN